MIRALLTPRTRLTPPKEWWHIAPCLKVVCVPAVGASSSLTAAGLASHPDAAVKEWIKKALDARHSFISLGELEREDLPQDSACVHLTLDDATTAVLPMLQWLNDHGVPATVFVSTQHAQSGQPYWWNVVRRRRLAQGTAEEKISQEVAILQEWPAERLQQHLVECFGAAALEKADEDTRPLSALEIQQLSRSAVIRFANRTHSHSILSALDAATLREEITTCSRLIHEWTGLEAAALAYPAGAQTPAVQEAARECGIRICFTQTPAILSARHPLARPLETGRWLLGSIPTAPH